MLAFTAPLPLSTSMRSAPATTPARPQRPHFRASTVAVSSPAVATRVAPPVSAPPTRATRFREMASTAAQFLSLELKDHLANYAVTFGEKIKDLELINEIAVSDIREDGMDIDIVTCDHDGCVCIREHLDWLPGDAVCEAEDLVPAIRHLSQACGLDESMLS